MTSENDLMRRGSADVLVADTGTAKGRGVFAARSFKAGETVESAPVILINTPFTELPNAVQAVVFAWGSLTGGPASYAIALGFGSLYNHDNPANMRFEADSRRGVITFIAVREVNSGEELTINYNSGDGGHLSGDDHWFRAMKIAPMAGTT